MNLKVEFDEEYMGKYEALREAFNDLITSNKIWDVTNTSFQDRIKARSSAAILVDKAEVEFGYKKLPDIKFEYDALFFENANGADLYFYPNFIMMFSSKTKFAVLGYDELEVKHRAVRFTEAGAVPKDSEIIDATWSKVNTNGSRDKSSKTTTKFR